MTEQSQTAILEKHIRKTTITSNIVSVVIALVTALGVAYGFYYNTNNTLDSHTEQIHEVQSELKYLTTTVNDNAVFQGAIKEQIKALDSRLTRVENVIDRIEEKLDRVIIQTKN